MGIVTRSVATVVAGTLICGAGLGAVSPTAAAQRGVDTVRLEAAAPRAHVGAWVEYTVTALPARVAWGQRVRVLVRTRDAWEPIATMQFDRAGAAHGQVTGRQPGTGRYIARVLSTSGQTVAQSAPVTIVWTAN